MHLQSNVLWHTSYDSFVDSPQHMFSLKLKSFLRLRNQKFSILPVSPTWAEQVSKCLYIFSASGRTWYSSFHYITESQMWGYIKCCPWMLKYQNVSWLDHLRMISIPEEKKGTSGMAQRIGGPVPEQPDSSVKYEGQLTSKRVRKEFQAHGSCRDMELYISCKCLTRGHG